MDTLEKYRDIIETIFTGYASIPYALGDLQCETVFDRTRDRYLMVTFGRDAGKRVHFAVAHVDIVNGKLWIRRDNTEEGMATELAEAGVSQEEIVPAFKLEAMRRYTKFAVA